MAGLCPITESNLGDGFIATVNFERAGGRLAIGTDSNVLIAVNEELRTLEYSQRLRDQKRNRLGAPGASTGRSIFDAARSGGAQALALGPGGLVCGLAVGQAADIVVLDDAHTSLACWTDDATLDAWIFAVGDVVREVFAGGRRVVIAEKREPRLRLVGNGQEAVSSGRRPRSQGNRNGYRACDHSARPG